MKLLHKFKSIFNQSKAVIEERTSEEIIGELINRLIIKLKDDGKSIASPFIADDFGSFTVYVHNLGTDDSVIEIAKNDRSNEWNIKVKPIFKEF